MLMPGRNGHAADSGWTSNTGSLTLPDTLTLSSRTGNTPSEYRARYQINFMPGFESGTGDEFVAFITDEAGGGGSGSGSNGTDAGGYRYGFNGKENDNEVKGEGNQQDYGMRIYDPRLGRFLSVDPLTKGFPMLTPYQFASNTPLQAIDLDGLEAYHYVRFMDRDGKPVLALLEVNDIIEKKLVRTEIIMSDNGMGGVSADKIDIYENVKNPRKDYIVWNLDEFDRIPYDEKRTFKSLGAAEGALDSEFEGTSEDYQAVPGILFAESFAPTAMGFIRPPTRKTRTGRTGTYQMHHLIVKNLKKSSQFVQKAIKGGFKINGKKNLLPLTRFIKKFNTGVHAKHPKYTKQISDHLEGINISQMSDATAAKYLNQLNDHIIKRIKANKDVKLNDIDLKLNNFKFNE